MLSLKLELLLPKLLNIKEFADFYVSYNIYYYYRLKIRYLYKL